MGGRELETKSFGNVTVDPVQTLAAFRNVACRAGHDPAGLLELLDALGLPTTKQQLRVLKAKAAIEQAAREQHSKETQ